MRLGDGTGLDVIEALKRQRPHARAIVLTGYGNIATAVTTAVKMGAVDYLAKPADADDVMAALIANGDHKPIPPKTPCPPTASAGAYPARVRALRSQRLGDGPPPLHAPPHAPAHSRQARAALT